MCHQIYDSCPDDCELNLDILYVDQIGYLYSYLIALSSSTLAIMYCNFDFFVGFPSFLILKYLLIDLYALTGSYAHLTMTTMLCFLSLNSQSKISNVFPSPFWSLIDFHNVPLTQ